MGWFKSLFGGPRAPATLPPPAEVYLGLRKLALSITADKMGVVPTAENPDPPLGVMMETVHPGAIATLVGMADGTTSFYFSNGGGILGSGAHAPVAQATHAWLERAARFKDDLAPTTDFPSPAPQRVRFYLLFPSGVRTGETFEDDLVKHLDPLWPLFHDAQAVITQVRLHAPKR